MLTGYIILALSMARSTLSRISILFFAPVFVALALVAVSPAAIAQNSAQAVEFDSGILDHEKIDGPRWKRVNFDPLVEGTHTIRVAWDGDADIRFNLFRVNGSRITSFVHGSNPGVWSGELEANVRYYMGVWAASGTANYTATIEAETVDVAPLVVTAQPRDIAVTEGDDATFSVAATGSGTLSYQWFADDQEISGATSFTLTVSAATLADGVPAYSVMIIDANAASIISDSATLSVAERVTDPEGEEPVLPENAVSLGQGTLDSERVAGPRYVRLNFDSLATAIHTVTVTWDSDADVKFNVVEVNGDRVNDSRIEGSNPGVWSGELEANKEYFIGLWSVSGIANYTAHVLAEPVLSELEPAESVKVAFIGDQGTSANARAVLQLIANEDTDLLTIQGDLGYAAGAAVKWEANLNDTVGEDFPVVVVVGNHENFEWQIYKRYTDERIDRVSDLSCTGDTGVKSRCQFGNIEIVQVAQGVSEVVGVASEDNYAGYIRSSFADESENWRICSWHKNQNKLQTGGKKDQTGWEVYDACLDLGAFVVVGHEHAYSRTYLLSDFENQTIVHEDDDMTMKPGQSFVAVSGLGGQGPRVQKRGGNWWASIYTATQGATNGALFCEFEKDIAECYFKAIDGSVPDRFTLRRGT